jgi:hypothetical protein
MSVVAGGSVAIIAYLLPLVVVLVVRARRDRTTWETALDIPFTVAVDLLSVLFLTLVVRLETAVLLSRAAWLVGGSALAWRRLRAGQLAWPALLRPRDVASVVGAAALAVLVCYPISANYFIWDTQWHTGLSSALTAQRLPFINGLSQHDVLHYHFTGDVLAAMLKVLSGHVVSSNRALALAHDTMFALAAATVALMMLGTRLTRGWPVALSGLAVLLHGPLPVREGLGHPFWGYAYHAFLNLSYRPHYPVAVVLMLGALGALLFRLWDEGKNKAWSAVPVLVATLTAMSITDESSTALVGLLLGVVWLIEPGALAATRRRGLVLLALLPLLMLGANALFHASLAPGGPVQKLTASPIWRVGSTGAPALPLSSPDGTKAFLLDSLPFAVALAALVVHAVRSRSRLAVILAAANAVLIVTASVLALRVEINGDHMEVHRFYVFIFVLAAVSTLCLYGAMPPGSTERALVVLGVVLPPVGQVYWALQEAPTILRPWAEPKNSTSVYATDCRTSAGARFGESPRSAYVEPAQFYRFVGCRPVLSVGYGFHIWATKIQPALNPKDQLRLLAAELRDSTASIDAICRAGPPSADPVCAVARERASSCRKEGSEFLRCRLSVGDRQRLLGAR